MLQINKIRKATNEEWDSIWKNCTYSTYFHSREWAQIWEQYTKGKISSEPILIIFSDNKTALLPFSYNSFLKGIIKLQISSPAGTFGGWISDSDLTLEHATLLINLILKKYSNLSLLINPYDSLANQVIPSKITLIEETHVINLKQDDFSKIFKTWTKGHRSAVNKAINAGVQVSIASTQTEWDEYYKIYEDTVKRWGDKASSKYENRLFDIIFNMASNNIKLWIAKYDNTLIAGALCFYSNNHIVYWHGAALENYFNVRPVNLLIYEALKSAYNENYNWFDFNPSGGHEGVKSFKKSFGAEPLKINIINKQSFPIKFTRLVKKIIKRSKYEYNI